MSCNPSLSGYPPNGQILLVYSELRPDGIPMRSFAYVRVQSNATVPDQQDVSNGIVTKGVGAGADVHWSMLQQPVQTRNGPPDQSALSADGSLVPGQGSLSIVVDCIEGVGSVNMMQWSTDGTSLAGPTLDSSLTLSLP